jgi:gliding motility-associated lipoprotein GldH
MKTRTIVFLALLFTAVACNENRIYERHTDPSGNLEWKKDQVVDFTVDIADPSLTYNVIASLRFAQGFAFAELPIEIKRTSPSGEEVTEQFMFHPRNVDGSYNGEGAGDIWDLEVPYQSNMQFPEAGSYTYEIRHLSDRELLHMVMEVGLIVDKVVSQP